MTKTPVSTQKAAARTDKSDAGLGWSELTRRAAYERSKWGDDQMRYRWLQRFFWTSF